MIKRIFLYILFGAILFGLAGFFVSFASFTHSIIELRAAKSAGTGLELVTGIYSFHFNIIGFWVIGGILLGGIHIYMDMSENPWNSNQVAKCAVFTGLLMGILLMILNKFLVAPEGITHNPNKVDYLAAILMTSIASVLIEPLSDIISESTAPKANKQITYNNPNGKNQRLTH